MRCLSSLIERWAAEGVEPLAPEGPDAVCEAFADAGILATSDVIAVYGAIGGMREMDSEYWRLWPLAEVRDQEPSIHGASFSDYGISCWEYRLQPVSSDVSAVYIDWYDKTPPALIAHSLEAFLERYLSDARSLLGAVSAE